MEKVKWSFMTKFMLVVGLMIILVGCASKSNEPEKSKDAEKENEPNVGEETEETDSKKGGEMVVAYETDISNYDPIKSSVGSDHALLWPVYDSLISFSPGLEPQPGLAESWELPDNKTIILHLRNDVVFHDGTKMDAEAVKFNLERVNSEDSVTSNLKSVESIEIVDEKTVTLHLSQPDASVLMKLSDREGMMVSPTAVKESGDDFSQNPVGAGPYKMVNHVPNGEIVLEAHEEYWQEGKPHLDKITIKVMADENTRINGLKSGEVDFASNITASNIPSLENDSKIVIDKILSLRLKVLFLNSTMAPLDNKEIRQAIQYGINREELIQAINFGDGESASGIFPSSYWAADKNNKIEYDPEKAKELVKESGIENPKFIFNHFTTAYEQRIAEAIKSQLNEVGIEVELNGMELQAAVANMLAEKKAHALSAAWTGSPDPHMVAAGFFNPESYYNPGEYNNPELVSLVAQAIETTDQVERAELYAQINELGIIEEAMAIPLFFTPMMMAMNEKVKGFEANLLGKPYIASLWIEE